MDWARAESAEDAEDGWVELKILFPEFVARNS
jgi:hypothetical protein